MRDNVVIFLRRQKMRKMTVLGMVVIVGMLAFTSLSFGYTWNIQTVQDVSGQIEGSINSVAVSPVDGNFHVAYRAVSAGKLREGVGKSEPYTITDSVTGAGGNYRWISAAIGSNNVPWITACNTWSGGSVTASYNSGSGFTTETIATGTLSGSAIAVRSNNSPVVSYGTGGGDLKYAERTGANSWSISTVISGGGRYEDSQIALASNDSPYIAFRNDWNYTLLLALKNGSSWSTETVASNVMNSNNDGSGSLDDDQYSKVLDIAMDSSDQPVIVYTDTSGHVQLKVRTAANTYQSYSVTSSGIARSVAIAVDSHDKAYIAFNDVTKGDLLLASADLANLSAGFTTETVVSNSNDGINVQRYLDVAVQNNGLPVISFFQINGSPQMKLAVAVPEPATVGLIAAGVLGFVRRK